MATIVVVGTSFTIDGANTYVLPGAKSGPVTVRLVNLTSASFSGSITVKSKRAGSTKTPTTISYRKHYLNAAVGDETFVSPAITDTSSIEVNAAGLDVVLDCTSYTSGTMAVETDLLTG